MLSTTGGFLKIIEYKEPSVFLQIQFVPQQIEIERTHSVESVSIVGRNFPYKQYSGGDRSISFTLDFHTDSDDGRDVMEKIRVLEGWTMNQTYEEGLKVLILEFGGLFSESKWILESLSAIKIMDFEKKNGFFPRRASVDIKLSQYVDNEIKRNTFLNGNF